MKYNKNFKDINNDNLDNINGGGFLSAGALGLAGGMIGGCVGAVAGTISYIETGDADKGDKGAECALAGTASGASLGAGIGATMPTP